MSRLDALSDRNRTFAATFDGGSIEPHFSTVVVTCLDPRLDPARFLGLKLGEAAVLRSLGGRVTTEIERAVAVIAVMARDRGQPAPELAIIHHTECGMELLADPETCTRMSRESGADERDLRALAITSHEQSLADDIGRLRDSPVVPDDLVASGHVYDVKTGALRLVVPPAPLRERASG